MITRKEIEHLADLANLSFEGEKMDRIARDLENIVDMVNSLSQVNTENFGDSLLNLDISTVWREDEPSLSNTRDEVLFNAPHKAAGCIKVPKVVE